MVVFWPVRESRFLEKFRFSLREGETPSRSISYLGAVFRSYLGRREPEASERPGPTCCGFCVWLPLIAVPDYTERGRECKLCKDAYPSRKSAFAGFRIRTGPAGATGRNHPVSEVRLTAKKLVVSTYFQYIALAIGLVLLVVFVRQIGGVLLTFLTAAVLAYVLNPLVRGMEHRRVPRVVAVVGLFLVLGVAVAAGLLVVIIPAVGQVQDIVRNPQAFAKTATSLVNRAQDLPYVGEYVTSVDQQALTKLVRDNAPSAGQVFNVALGFIGGVFGVFGTILNLLLMLIVSIYLLLDRERITRAVLNAIPGVVRDQSVELFHVVEKSLGKYVRAQLTLCVIMGVIGWAIGQFAIGQYALVIGLWVAFTEIIPVLGAFLGAVPGVLIALFAEGFTTALVVAGLFLVAQQIEGNLLVPKIMGDSVGVHPLWVLFATLAATALYGLVGAILAVPIVAIISSTFRYLRGTLLFEDWRKPPVTPAEAETDIPPSLLPGRPPSGSRGRVDGGKPEEK